MKDLLLNMYNSLRNDECVDIVKSLVKSVFEDDKAYPRPIINTFKNCVEEYTKELGYTCDLSFIDSLIKYPLNTDRKNPKLFKLAYNFFLKNNFYMSRVNVINANVDRVLNIGVLSEAMNVIDDASVDIFVHFKELDQLLEQFDIPCNSKIELLTELININCSRFDSYYTNLLVIDRDKIRKHEFKHLSTEHVLSLIELNQINDFINDKNIKHKKAKKELHKFAMSNLYDIKDTIKSCEQIQSILNKIECTEEDYHKLNKYLINLGINNNADKFVNRVRKQVVSSKIEVSPKIEEKQDEDLKKEEKKSIKKTYSSDLSMSKKERNTFYRQLNAYFDFDEMKPIRTLTYDEIIYVVSLLKQVNTDDSIINQFIFISEKNLRKYNPLLYFQLAKEKFIYYKDIENIGDLINQIEDIYNNYTEEDYEEYLNIVDSYLKDIIRVIPDNYIYEKEKAKEINKERKI